MNGSLKKVLVGTSIVVLSALILWLASHAARAESFMATTPVHIEVQQKQLDRMEEKLDWLIQQEIKRAAE
ncbi:MAG: hypothetical protein ACYS8I_10645 [Planctomycetota bacterium]|jgi:hypothetical protein